MDVHAPHTAIHTWRDFFIHIATIVVGLIIAVGLEQTVEWLHHVHQIREIRRDLRNERALNVASFHLNVHYLRDEHAMFENNLRVFQYLQQHPGTPPEKLPGVPRWGAASGLTTRSAWDSAQQSDALALMPKPEVETSRRTYDQLRQADALYELLSVDVDKADAYQFLSNDVSKLTPAQVDAEIPLIRDCLSSVYTQFMQLSNIARLFPEFAPGPTKDELKNFHGQPQTDSKSLQQAQAFTDRDAAAAAAVDAAQAPLIEFNRQLNLRGPAHINEIYAESLKTDPAFQLDEHLLNRRGYDRLYDHDFTGAIEIFKLNAKLFPNSWNAYDSLAEAYSNNGQKRLAIENYETSIKLNPANISGIQHLHELKGN